MKRSLGNFIFFSLLLFDFRRIIEPQSDPTVQFQALDPMSRKMLAFGAGKNILRHSQISVPDLAAAEPAQRVDADRVIVKITFSYHLIDLKWIHRSTPLLFLFYHFDPIMSK